MARYLPARPSAVFGPGLAAGSLAGLLTALNDFGASWLWLERWSDRAELLLRLVALQVPAAGVLGALVASLHAVFVALAARGLAERTARPAQRLFSTRLGLCWAVAALPGSFWCVTQLLTGGSMALLPHRSLVALVGALCLAAALGLGLALVDRIVRSRRFRDTASASGLGLGFWLAGTALCKLDQWTLPRLYEYAHGLATLCALVCFGLACFLFVRHLRFVSRPVAQSRVRLGISLALGAGIWSASLALPEMSQSTRVALTDPTASNSRSLLKVLRPLLLVVSPSVPVEQHERMRATVRRRVRQREALSLGASAAGAAPCGVTLERAHILLITVDALRADHLSSYGYHRRTSVALDRFAEQAVLFVRAYAQAPHSSFSLASLMTSEYLHETTQLGLPLPQATLASVLRAHGYHTAAFYTRGIFHTSADQLRAYDRSGFGFSLRVHRDLEASSLTARVLEEIEHIHSLGEPPSLLWAHYFDVHEPYVADTFGDSARDRYDSEIAKTDHAVGKLMAGARERLRRPLIIVVSADHGEEFREHGGVYHGTSLYDEQTRVPLLVQVPGCPARRVGTPVELVDIAPTLLTLTQMPRPSSMRGDDLSPLLRGESLELGPAFSAVIHKRMVVRWPHKLIADLTFGRFELYNLKQDPAERRNLADQRPGVLRPLRGEIHAWLDSLRATREAPARDGWQAALARGRLMDRRAVVPLGQAAVDEDAPIALRVEACRVLGRLKDQRARPRLLRALHSDRPQVVREAAIALGYLREPRARRHLRPLVNANDPELRMRAAMALARLRDTEAVPALIDTLRFGRSVQTRLEAVRWLGRLGDPQAFEPLMSVLPDARLRHFVVLALGLIREPRALDPLLNTLAADPHPDVRDNTARALGLLGDAGALPALLRLAQSDPGLKHANEALVRLRAIELGWIGGRDLESRPANPGWGRCHAEDPRHDWNYLHRTWCPTRRRQARLILQISSRVREGAILVFSARRLDASAASRVQIRVGQVELTPTVVDGRWTTTHWSLPQSSLTGPTSDAVLQLEPDTRLAVDHLLLLPSRTLARIGQRGLGGKASQHTHQTAFVTGHREQPPVPIRQ